MRLTSTAFADGDKIPDRYALATPDPETHATLSDNLNPALMWSSVPQGARSLVLICVDPDAPSKPDDVNKEDREVPSDLPRTDFYHWVMVDVPTHLDGIEEGACSNQVVPGGKQNPAGPEGSRQGVNDYTGWFGDDPDMAGQYLGYDGPAPPWNDSIPHRYRFRLLAIDLERCPVGESFTAPEVLEAVENHILDEAELTGTYTLNPRLR